MKTLHIDIANKIATYQKADGAIVCGNSDYQVEFAFDEEWAAHATKKARFVYGGIYKDVEFTGNTCPIPVIVRATEVEVGVYVEGVNMATTTGAKIPCVLSILCKGANATNGKVYVNGDSVFVRYSANADGTDFTEEHSEGQRYIGIATGQSAPTNKTGYTWSEYCADNMVIVDHGFRIGNIEKSLDIYDPFTTLTSDGTNTITVPTGSAQYAKISKIYGRFCESNTFAWYYMYERNTPTKITLDNGTVIEIPEFESYYKEDYIFFAGGKAYFHRSTRWDAYECYELAEGEEILYSVNDGGTLVKLAEPIITDISNRFDFDGLLDLTGATSITVAHRWNNKAELQAWVDGAKDESADGYCWFDCGGIVVDFEIE